MRNVCGLLNVCTNGVANCIFWSLLCSQMHKLVTHNIFKNLWTCDTLGVVVWPFLVQSIHGFDNGCFPRGVAGHYFSMPCVWQYNVRVYLDALEAVQKQVEAHFCLAKKAWITPKSA